MDFIEALILGIVQGLTEWLPVSSSGHLVIAQELLEVPADENLVFDLVVHLGTLAAVCLYFRKELGRIVGALLSPRSHGDEHAEALRKLGYVLLVGTIPVALVGVLLTDYVEEVFDLRVVGFALVVNAAALFMFERRWSRGKAKAASYKDALVIGTFQAASIVPGISRSGMTLGGGLVRGLERETAAVFAFLLSVPALVGAFGYGAATLERYDTDLAVSAVGFVSALLTGLASIAYLLKAVREGKLWVFAVYCAVVGGALILWTAV